MKMKILKISTVALHRSLLRFWRCSFVAQGHVLYDGSWDRSTTLQNSVWWKYLFFMWVKIFPLSFYTEITFNCYISCLLLDSLLDYAFACINAVIALQDCSVSGIFLSKSLGKNYYTSPKHIVEQVHVTFNKMF